jgi:serine/threonine-protein kinase
MTDAFARLNAALEGRYRIERQLGQGGMATVYLATDVRHQRQVAVKVLRSDLAAALGSDRFLREIRIAANLTHPHILPLHDSGEADGFLYYVMPYIVGQTLRERIEKEGALPVTEAVRIVCEVVDALALAHSQGVVHRDVKPDNVMLTGGHAMVADFGVAKAVSDATDLERNTTAGTALGTPAYMAPEQAAADPHVDHRADLYAVGVMAYELLAGRTPFAGLSAHAMLAAHVTEQPEPVRKYRDQVSGELESVVMKCLAKKPADRWQSAQELLPHLEAVRTSSGNLTPTDTRPIAAAAVSRRPRSASWLWAASIAGLLLAVGGASWLLTGANGPPGVDRIAVVPFADASGQDGEFLNAMHNSLIASLAGIDGATVVARSAVMKYQDERLPDREISAELNIGGIVDAQVFRIGERARLTVQFSEALTSGLLWAETYDLAGDDVFAVQDSLVGLVTIGISTALRAPDPTERQDR